jgi:FHA domain
MTPIIGTVLLFLMCTAVAGAITWLILGKIASRQRLSGPAELLLEFLPEPTATTPRGLNRAIKALIRRAAIPMPNGKRAMSLVVIRLRDEDLAVLKAAYGLAAYTADLASYHQKVATRRGWKLGQDLNPTVIRFVTDPSRKPMRPAVDPASSAAVLPDGTQLFGKESDGPTRDERTDDQKERRRPPHASASGSTEPGARFVGPGIDRLVFPSEAPVSIGRSHENSLVIRGETVHRQHARLEYSKGVWTLVPLKFGSSTTVNGSVTTAPVSITGDAALSFGDSGGFTFSAGGS